MGDISKDVSSLLKSVEKVTKEYDEKANIIRDKDFNLFNLFAAENDEVSVCWVIYSLLSSNGGHGMEDTYLNLFCEHVLKLESKGKKAFRNVSTTYGRFIDLAVKTCKEQFIPIEVKIHAYDQKNQCYDYYKYAEEKNAGFVVKPPIYYLTLTGNKPSLDSRGNLDDEQIKIISFKEDIINWLGRCLQKTPINHERARVNIIQFMDEIERWINNMNNSSSKTDDILNVLTQKPQTVIDIWEAIVVKYRDFSRVFYDNVIKELNKHLEKDGLLDKVEIGQESWGINARIKEKIMLGNSQFSLLIRLISETSLGGVGIGYVLYNGKDAIHCRNYINKNNENIDDDTIKTALKIEKDIPGWYAYYDCIKYNDERIELGITNLNKMISGS